MAKPMKSRLKLRQVLGCPGFDGGDAVQSRCTDITDFQGNVIAVHIVAARCRSRDTCIADARRRALVHGKSIARPPVDRRSPSRQEEAKQRPGFLFTLCPSGNIGKKCTGLFLGRPGEAYHVACRVGRDRAPLCSRFSFSRYYIADLALKSMSLNLACLHMTRECFIFPFDCRADTLDRAPRRQGREAVHARSRRGPRGCTSASPHLPGQAAERVKIFIIVGMPASGKTIARFMPKRTISPILPRGHGPGEVEEARTGPPPAEISPWFPPSSGARTAWGVTRLALASCPAIRPRSVFLEECGSCPRSS